MATHIFFSRSAQALSDQFIQHLTESRKDPFSSPVVIIPNTQIEVFLKRQITDQIGICANVTFSGIENAFATQLIKLEKTTTHQDHINSDKMHLLVQAALLKVNQDERLKPWQDYLRASHSEFSLDFPECIDRFWQLSLEIAHLFMEYENHRFFMLDKWLNKLNTIHDKTELAQAVLYCSIFAEGGLIDQNQSQWLSMASIIKNLDQSIEQPKKSEEPLFIFIPSHLSVSHYKVLYHICQSSDIYIYLLNFCHEFWEDMISVKEANRLERKLSRVKSLKENIAEDEHGEFIQILQDPELILSQENELLRLWGVPGREMVTLLSMFENDVINEQDIEDRWLGIEESFKVNKKSMLSLIQSLVFNRTDSPEVLGLEKLNHQDESLQIFYTCNRKREVETVLSSILYDLKNDPELSLSDIAIACPDINQYRSVISNVFDNIEKLDGHYGIPWSCQDPKQIANSSWAQAISIIIDLPGEHFSRKKVIELIRNPCFAQVAEINEEDMDLFSEILDQLNIFNYLDEHDRLANHLDKDLLYTWKQAFMRLNLAHFMQVNEFPNHYAWHEWQACQEGQALQNNPQVLTLFIRLEQLFERLIHLSSLKADAQTWRQSLVSLFDEFLQIPEHLGEERDIRETFIRHLQQWSAIDQFFEEENECRFEYWNTLIHSFVSKTSIRQESSLAGLTVASFRNLRPRSFRHVYLLGLGEGQYPRRSTVSNLDLRKKKRKVGDISFEEADQYLFMEILLSVKEKLIMSYIGYDKKEDRFYQPSAILLELIDYIERNVLTRNVNQSQQFEVTSIPNDPADISYLQKNKQESSLLHAYDDFYMSLSLQKHPVALKNVISKLVKNDRYIEHCLEKYSRHVLLPNADKNKIDKQQATVKKIKANHLIQFLRDSSQAFIKHQLFVYSEEHSQNHAEKTEPIVMDSDRVFLHFQELCQIILKQFHHSKGNLNNTDLKEILLQYIPYLKQNYKTLQQPFHQQEEMELISLIENLLSSHHITGFLNNEHGSQLIAAPQIGKTALDYKSDLILPEFSETIKIAEEDLEYNISMNIPWYIKRKNQQLVFILFARSGGEEWYHRPLVEAWLFYNLLLSQKTKDFIIEQPVQVQILSPSGIHQWELPLVEEREARIYLKCICEEWLGLEHLENFPLQLAMDVYKKLPEDQQNNTFFDQQLSEKIERQDEKVSPYAPDILKVLETKSVDQGFDLIHRRFGKLTHAKKLNHE